MKIKANKILAVVCVIAMIMTMIVPMTLTAAAAETYSYTFTAKQFTANGTKKLDGVDWTLSGDGNYWGYDSTKGQQFGSGNAPYKSMTLTSESFSNVSKIVINTSGASSISGSFTVTVGGTTVGSSTKLTASATNYTFECDSLSGPVVLTYTQTSSKAIYIKSISVTYTEGNNVPECDECNWGEYEVTTAATCTTDGAKKRTCSVCGNVETASIAATGHNYVDGVCDKCGEEQPEGYVLVTNVSDLKVGDDIVIVAKDYDYALSTDQKSNNRGQASVTKAANTVTFGDDVQIIKLDQGTVDGTFAFFTGSGYLYAASSSANHLKTQTSKDNNGSWKITIADGTATIVAQGDNSRSTMQYNQSSSLFACYASASQKAISIYKLPSDASACGHENETNIVTVPATCTENGSKTFVCGDCGETVTEPINALGHNFVDNTCTNDGCGAYEYTPMTIAEAIASADGTKVMLENVVIIAIDTEYSEQYDNISVVVQDSEGSTLLLYRLKGNFEVGTTITAKGEKLYYQQTTHELKAGCTAEIIKDSPVSQLNAVNAYMSLAYKYVETTEQESTTLSDSEFVFKCGVDAALANIEGVDSFGIAVTAGGKTVYYTEGNATSWAKGNERISVAIALGDIINDQDKLNTEFTVRAFVEVGGVKFESELTKAHSVASMIAAYNAQGIEEVAHLYGILFPNAN